MNGQKLVINTGHPCPLGARQTVVHCIKDNNMLHLDRQNLDCLVFCWLSPLVSLLFGFCISYGWVCTPADFYSGVGSFGVFWLSFSTASVCSTKMYSALPFANYLVATHSSRPCADHRSQLTRENYPSQNSHKTQERTSAELALIRCVTLKIQIG